jgi:hypothetical protein
MFQMSALTMLSEVAGTRGSGDSVTKFAGHQRALRCQPGEWPQVGPSGPGKRWGRTYW